MDYHELKLIDAVLDYAKDICKFRQEFIESNVDDENQFAWCLLLDTSVTVKMTNY